MRYIFLSLAIMGLLSAGIFLPAGAESHQLKEGIASFKRGDYKDAVEWLKIAAGGEDAQNPEAHYYLANALHRDGRVKQALAEYRACLNLNPKPAMELYCLRALEHYESRTTKSRHARYKQAQKKADRKVQKPKIVEPNVDLSRLPPLRRYRPSRLGVGYATVLGWNLYQRADYLSQASANLEDAQDDLDEAERARKTAGSMLHSLVPRFRAYGEGEDEFMVRYNQAKAKAESIVGPYKQEEEKMEMRLNEAQQVYDLCAQASRLVGPFRPYYPGFYGNPYYRGPRILPYPHYGF